MPEKVNRKMKSLLIRSAAVITVLSSTAVSLSSAPWVSLFDGKSLDGWTMEGPGYIVDNGWLVCPSTGGGVIYTRGEYSDFVLRFDYRLNKGGNNGVALRVPLKDAGGYDVLESQILDNEDPMYKDLVPGQYHGSLYKVAPARRGATKPHDQWNTEEIEAIGRQIKIRVNDQLILDTDINKITDPAILFDHPGLLRDYGRLGFMGHGPAEVMFRNIAVQDLSKTQRDNTAPKGFTALFNGRDLKGWKGLVASPPERAKMSPEQLAAAQKKADEAMRAHWSIAKGILTFDGMGDSLCTTKDYADFEMLVDWKIESGGDSGIYLRGAPQVQIWDNLIGSGGLYN
ncbi:MAG: DUF1080 domain-containing protein, partial [Armatimonadota bacterium]